MQRIKLTLAELDQINPEDFAIAMWVGSNDTLLQSGTDIINAYIEFAAQYGSLYIHKNLAHAFQWQVSEMSRNSYELILVKDGKLYELDIDYE